VRIVTLIAWAALATVIGAGAGHAEKRVALVVGNDRYANLPADQQLQKAVNDSRAVGDALTRIGFDVISGENLGRQALVDKFDELTQRLAPGDTAFFFFAGHGVAIGGSNYILPSDVPNVEAGQDTRLARAALGETDIVTDLQGRGVRVAVVVLDACRNNPFRQPGVRGVGGERGLGRIEPVRGVFTLYSAGIGQTALDRLGNGDGNPNSVFTRALVPRLAVPELDLTALAIDVREEVARLARSVGHDQRPAYYDETIGGRVYLAAVPSLPSGNPAASAPPPSVTEDEIAWSLIDKGHAGNLQRFVERFPSSVHAAEARALLEKFNASQPASHDTPIQQAAIPPSPVAAKRARLTGDKERLRAFFARAEKSSGPLSEFAGVYGYGQKCIEPVPGHLHINLGMSLLRTLQWSEGGTLYRLSVMHPEDEPFSFRISPAGSVSIKGAGSVRLYKISPISGGGAEEIIGYTNDKLYYRKDDKSFGYAAKCGSLLAQKNHILDDLWTMWVEDAAKNDKIP